MGFVLLQSCKEDPQYWVVDSVDQVIGDYIASNPDKYSEFEKLIEITGYTPLLKIRGPYTFFVADNEAMEAYYQDKGVSKLEDFDPEFLEELVLTHLVTAYIGSTDIGLGALREPNALGDYLVSEFVGSDILISKSAIIIDRDIFAANGIIHQLDRPLDPVKEDLFTVISSDPSYSIFAAGLELTGIKDTLEIITFPYGSKTARTRFTVLGVTDSVFSTYGIQSVEELQAWCGGHPDSADIVEDEFYRYMEYHCLHKTYYLSTFETGVYPVLSKDNNVSFRVDDDYKINYDRITKEYTGFIVPYSNTPAKNGALHAIDDILPAVEPEPAAVLFETTEFFDLQQQDCYQTFFGRFFDGENTFEKIKWTGDYLLYYCHGKPNSAIRSDDCLSMQGWWEISITFPKVMKGAYDVIVAQPTWGDITDAAVYLDGVRTKYLYTGPYGTGDGGPQKVADAVFDKTEEHTITLRNVSAGMVFWDYVEFVPVN